MKQSGATAYLVNTGWNGTGKRISIKDTRGIIDASWTVRSTRLRPRRCRYSISRSRPHFRAWIPRFSIRATRTRTPRNGTRRRQICRSFRQELREVHRQRRRQETRSCRSASQIRRRAASYFHKENGPGLRPDRSLCRSTARSLPFGNLYSDSPALQAVSWNTICNTFL